jgi:hypothetical protein
VRATNSLPSAKARRPLFNASGRSHPLSPCPFALSATTQHYFSLKTNQLSAISNSIFLLEQIGIIYEPQEQILERFSPLSPGTGSHPPLSRFLANSYSSDILAAGWDQHELGPRPQSRRFSPGGVSSNSSPPRSKRDEPSALQLISTVDGAGRASRSEPDRATELLRARSKISKPCGTRVPVIAAATRVRTWDAGWLPFAAATASGRRETRRIWQSGPADSWAITMMPPVHDGQPGRGRARTFPRAFYSPLPSVMAGSKNRGVTSPETKSPNGSVRFSCCACAHTYLDSWSTVLANF